MNALKFGFYTAQDIILKTESADQFERLRESYYDQYRPESEREAELVEEIASSAWRLRRIPIIGRDLMQNECYPDESMGRTFCQFADEITKLDRNHRSLRRSKKEAIQKLEAFQKQKLQNEPKPQFSGHDVIHLPSTNNPIPDNQIQKEEKPQNEPNEAEEDSQKRTQRADHALVQHLARKLEESTGVRLHVREWDELQALNQQEVIDRLKKLASEVFGKSKNCKNEPKENEPASSSPMQ